MMTGKTLIQGVNLKEKDYPHICEIPLFLYDANGLICNDPNFSFSKDLFIENFEEKERFIALLNELEMEKTAYLDVQINDYMLTIFSKTSFLKMFCRKK